jgi:hypothetical protein
MLQSVNETENGWRNVVDGRDPKNFCSANDIFIVRQRSAILCTAYQLAMEQMPDWNWYLCCTEACKRMNRFGCKQATHCTTVANWNIAFRLLENFPHPNPRVQCGKVPLPRLFEKFPEAKDSIVTFAVEQIATLTLESVHEFTVTKLIPKLFTIWKEEESKMSLWQTDAEFLTEELFLENHGLKTVGLTTVWRWMKNLGFSYDMRKKSFYVDGHERSDVVEDRNSFCTDYLTVYEPRCLRWVQLRKDDVVKIDGAIIDFGYNYVDPTTGIEMVEFHVDYCHKIDGLKENTVNLQMSVRAPQGSKPLMIVGQDECVFTQFLLGQKTWVGSGGSTNKSMATEEQQLLYSEIERLSKDFKVHRCALDFDRGFVNAELKCAADNQR